MESILFLTIVIIPALAQISVSINYTKFKQLKNKKEIPYCYVLSENNKVFSIVENQIPCEKINEFQNEISFEME